MRVLVNGINTNNIKISQNIMGVVRVYFFRGGIPVFVSYLHISNKSHTLRLIYFNVIWCYCWLYSIYLQECKKVIVSAIC